MKNKFKWLSYVLRLEEGELIFDEPAANQAITGALSVKNQMFQYTTKTSIRWKTFKTYVIPFIELYLPYQAQKGIDRRTLLHKAQHSCLSATAGLSHRNSQEKLLAVMCELSIRDKTIRMAKRISPFLHDTFTWIRAKLDKLDFDPEATRNCSGMTRNRMPTEPRVRIIKSHMIYALMKASEQSFSPIRTKLCLKKVTTYSRACKRKAQWYIKRRARQRKRKSPERVIDRSRTRRSRIVNMRLNPSRYHI